MRVALSALAALALTAVAGQALAADWPGGRRAAVVLTYDDALQSQLDIAIPALDAAGLKGTFFLGGRWIAPKDVARWRAVAANGHELGNHTVFHPCARATYDMPARYNSEGYSVETMLDEIRTMNAFLTAIDGKTVHSYGPPCGQPLVGGQDYFAALRASGLVRYARDIPGMDAGTNPPSLWFPESATGADMIAGVKAATQKDGIVILGFHGVGGDYLKVSGQAHAELVAYLKANEATIWVAPLTTALDAMAAQKK